MVVRLRRSRLPRALLGVVLTVGCDNTVGHWSGTMTCPVAIDDATTTDATFDVELDLALRSRWSTEGDGTLGGEMSLDSGGSTATWWQSFSVVIEQTQFSGEQDLKVTWTDGECEGTLDGEPTHATCDDEGEMPGWRWTGPNYIEIDNPSCSGALGREDT